MAGSAAASLTILLSQLLTNCKKSTIRRGRYGMSEPTLSSPVTLLDQTLWFGEIRLQDNEITVSGWTWTGPFRRRIPIRKIMVFETWAGGKGDNYFRMMVDGGNPVRGQIGSGIGLWEMRIEADGRVDLKRQHRRHGCTVSLRHGSGW